MNANAEPRPSDWRLPFLLAVAPFLWLVWRFRFLTDDAYISFCYAKNFAHGHGLVFNVGEDPRVEGYSNLLWVLLLSLFERLGADVTLWSRLCSTLCGLLLFALVARLLFRRAALSGPLLLAALLLYAALPPLTVWCTGGLATMPFALAVFATFERLLGEPGRARPGQAAICAALALLLRADGFVWIAMVLVCALLLHPAQERRALWRPALGVVAATAATFAALTLWRLGYYGDWLPNTARVKVGLSAMSLERGLRYALSFLVVFPSLVLALLLCLKLYRRRSALALSAAAIFLGTLAYAVVVGGDYLTMGRFLIPGLPFGVLLFGLGLGHLSGSGGRRLAMGVAAVAIAAALAPGFDRHVTPRAWREALHFRWKRESYKSEYQEWAGTRIMNARLCALGRALKQFTAPGESLPMMAVGAVRYYSDLRVFDQWGLTNREVRQSDAERIQSSPGHDRGVPREFFLKDRVTYLGAGFSPPETGGKVPPNLRIPVTVEAHPLPPGVGFPQEKVLKLLRVDYARLDAGEQGP